MSSSNVAFRIEKPETCNDEKRHLGVVFSETTPLVFMNIPSFSEMIFNPSHSVEKQKPICPSILAGISKFQRSLAPIFGASEADYGTSGWSSTA